MNVIIPVIGVNLALLAGFFFYFRRLIRKKTDQSQTLSRLREEIEELIQDLNQTTERNLVILEDHVQKLRGVISNAEKTMSVLRRETEKNESSRLTYQHLKKTAVKVDIPAPPKPVQDELPLEVENPDKQEKQEDRKRPRRKTRAELTRDVLKYHKQGLAPSLISDKCGLPSGEVELIISIYARE